MNKEKKYVSINEITKERISQIPEPVDSEALEAAQLYISQYASFKACYFENPELEATYLHDGRAILCFDFETETYTLITPIAAAEQNIIKAAAEIQKRENLIAKARMENNGISVT